MTYSGHRLPDFLLKDDLAIIPWDGWFYPAKKTRLRKNVLAVSLDGRQGVLRTMDKKRFRRLHKRYAKLMKQYRSQAESVAAEYRAARDEMTSLPFWMKYLEID